MELLEQLKQDPNCLYIYNWGPYIYGLEEKPGDYIVIVTDNGKSKNKSLFPESGRTYFFVHDNIYYQFYRIKYGFDKVLAGDIDCWECACLNKKFIIKEHVKLMMSTNPLNLRKYVDSLRYKSDICKSEASIYELWSDIKRCKFANQIIDNHKIVNFKEANKDYILLKNSTDIVQAYNSLITNPYQELRQRTDELLLKDKIEKILQKEKNE